MRKKKDANGDRGQKEDDCPTVNMRVPRYMKEAIETYIRLQADFVQKERGYAVEPLSGEEERNRMELFHDFEALHRYEQERKKEKKRRELSYWIDSHTPSLFSMD